MLRNADVAKMLPCVPAAMTATEATNTMKSEGVGMARSRPAPGSQPTPCQEPEVGDRSVESVSEARVWVRVGVKGQAQEPGLITDDTEGFSGKAEAALPSSVAAAASSGPDADDVLQAKHHDHHKLLWGQRPEFSPFSRTEAQVTQPRNSLESLS